MIASVCANPCVDRTVYIDRFEYGGMNRITDIHEEGCGKGVTVALAATRLGMDAACLCLLPERSSDLLLDSLKGSVVQANYISCPGSLRVNTKVFDRSLSITTEINDKGCAVPDTVPSAFLDAAVRLAEGCSHIVLTGSLPPGFPKDFYRSVIEAVKQAAPRCRVALDAEGTLLVEGVLAKPFLVKPNRYELELLCGRKLDSVAAIHQEAQRLIADGISLVGVTMGPDGAYITDGADSYFAPALRVAVRSTLGAGDSMLAGMLYALERELPIDQILRCGVAAAAASVATDGTGLTGRAQFDEYLPNVVLSRV